MKRFIIGLSLSLVGCNSFNSTVIMENSWQPTHVVNKIEDSAPSAYPPPPASPVKPTVKIIKRVIKLKGDVCPRMELPPLEKTPALPIEAIHAIDPADHEKADRLVMQYVRDLRAYTDRVAKREADYRAKYRQACQAYQRASD